MGPILLPAQYLPWVGYMLAPLRVPAPYAEIAARHGLEARNAQGHSAIMSVPGDYRLGFAHGIRENPDAEDLAQFEAHVAEQAPVLRERLSLMEPPVGITRTPNSDNAVITDNVTPGWAFISKPPRFPVAVEFYYANLKMGGKDVVVPSWRDYRRGLGYWDGEMFRELWSGHSVFEPWMDPTEHPTHWRPLPDAPPKGYS